jgi:antitoxin (DNA-binding transcriptional repressor) of toxin-antitoxin stability system
VNNCDKISAGASEMTQITLQNAEKNWAEILQKALEGEEVIIERDGKPVAKVSPYKEEEDWFGMDEGKGWIADDFDDTPEDLIKAFEGDEI